MGPGVACESIEDRGDLYIWEDHFYPEIVHKDTFEVLQNNQEGELVLTSLTKEALPIIRYRTKDISTLYEGELLNMRKMKRIKARTDDMMIIRGVNVFPSQIEEILLKIPVFAAHYQLVITRVGNLDELCVLVELQKALSNDVATKHINELKHKVKSSIGISIKVQLCESGSIPRSMGKASRVVDKRNI